MRATPDVMAKTNRRDFVRRTGIGVAGLSALDIIPLARGGPAVRPDAIPSCRSMDVPGVYAFQLSTALQRVTHWNCASARACLTR